MKISEMAWPKTIFATGIAVFGMALATAFAPTQADARPTRNPYNTQNSGAGGAFGAYGEWCDEFPVNEAGDHFHCEFGGFIGYGGGCSWRNASQRGNSSPSRSSLSPQKISNTTGKENLCQ